MDVDQRRAICTHVSYKGAETVVEVDRSCSSWLLYSGHIYVRRWLRLQGVCSAFHSQMALGAKDMRKFLAVGLYIYNLQYSD